MRAVVSLISIRTTVRTGILIFLFAVSLVIREPYSIGKFQKWLQVIKNGGFPDNGPK